MHEIWANAPGAAEPPPRRLRPRAPRRRLARGAPAPGGAAADSAIEVVLTCIRDRHEEKDKLKDRSTGRMSTARRAVRSKTTTYDGRFAYEAAVVSSDEDSSSDEDAENPRHRSGHYNERQLRGDGSRTRSTRGNLSSPSRGKPAQVVEGPLSPTRKSASSNILAASMVGKVKKKFTGGSVTHPPNCAFVRVNIMDVPHYSDEEKVATVKLYIDVSWRARNMEQHLRDKPVEKPYKWSNTDGDDKNGVPREFYEHCPIEFPGVGKKHHVSDFVENHVVASDIETWEDWFEMDKKSEERFETMGEPLDPEGRLGTHTFYSPPLCPCLFLCCIAFITASSLAVAPARCAASDLRPVSPTADCPR